MKTATSERRLPSGYETRRLYNADESRMWALFCGGILLGIFMTKKAAIIAACELEDAYSHDTPTPAEQVQ